MTRAEIREKLVELLEGMESGFASWQEGEPEAVADYILAEDPSAARNLVEMAEEGHPYLTNRLADWINAWERERQGLSRSRVVRAYLRSWEWDEVERAAARLVQLGLAHSKAGALGYLALAGARLLDEGTGAFTEKLAARR
ncbi:hypothetical protein [Thermus hydrothermalis]|nr:hypothetical protein [Thermus hydrothermalis]